jgi:hypothetical protein
VPSKNDGTTIYDFNVKDVPVDGFWSVTVYDETGDIRKNSLQIQKVSAQLEASKPVPQVVNNP